VNNPSTLKFGTEDAAYTGKPFAARITTVKAAAATLLKRIKIPP